MHRPVIQCQRDAFGLGIVLLDQVEVAIHLLDVEATALAGDHDAAVDLNAGGNAPLLGRGRLPCQLDPASARRIGPAHARAQFLAA